MDDPEGQDMSGKDDKVAERRGFLRTLGIGAAAAAAAVPAAAQRADQVPAGQARKENEADRLKARYRVTEDVAAFYRTNRYEY